MAIRTRQEQLLDNLNTTGRVTLNNGFGQLGSILVKGTTDVTSSGVIAGAVFVSLTFIEDTVFNSGDAGLIPEVAGLFPTSADALVGTGIDGDAGGNTDSVSFPAGLTIHGRWTGFTLASGKIIAYINY